MTEDQAYSPPLRFRKRKNTLQDKTIYRECDTLGHCKLSLKA
jgi:hypothetical protein